MAHEDHGVTLFAYFGPETTLPVFSVAASAAGLVMLLWNRIARCVRRLARGETKPSAVRRAAIRRRETHESLDLAP
jgi:hypothetical protein